MLSSNVPMYGEKKRYPTPTHTLLSRWFNSFSTCQHWSLWLGGLMCVCVCVGGGRVFIITYYTSWNCQIPTEKCHKYQFIIWMSVRRLLGDERAGGDGYTSMCVQFHVRSWRYPSSCIKCIAGGPLIIHKFSAQSVQPFPRYGKGGGGVRTCERIRVSL